MFWIFIAACWVVIAVSWTQIFFNWQKLRRLKRKGTSQKQESDEEIGKVIGEIHSTMWQVQAGMAMMNLYRDYYTEQRRHEEQEKAAADLRRQFDQVTSIPAQSVRLADEQLLLEAPKP